MWSIDSAGLQDMARRNRAYLRRVVLELADLGIRQFLDLGSGIPTVGNVHEVAHEVAPESKVVYVDALSRTAEPITPRTKAQVTDMLSGRKP